MINFSLLDEAFPNDDKMNIKKKKKNDDKDNKDQKDQKDQKENTCKPLQAPAYIMPSMCDNTSTFRKVISDSMNETLGKDDFKKNGIRAYDYDEMDAYLSVNNIKTNNIDSSNEYRTTPFLADYLKSLRDNFKKPMSKATDNYENIEQFTNLTEGLTNNVKIDINLYNLFLFIFLGIVIIVLIDQITKLVSINQK